MAQVKLYNPTNKNTTEIEANASVFGQEANPTLVWQVETAFMAGQRQGTASTKTRAEVRGGGKKPWKQKGTGRARTGSIRNPVWVGGGVTFGPKPRDYSQGLPKKMKKLALKVVLSEKAKNGKVIVFEEIKLTQPKTKEVSKLLKEAKLVGKMLIVVEKENDQIIKRATKNLPKVTLINSNELNIHDLLSSDWLILTKGSLAEIEGRLN